MDSSRKLNTLHPPLQMIAFIHLGKTAGSTFKNLLRRSFGFHHCDAIASRPDHIFRDDDLRLARRIHPGLWSLCSHHFQDPVHTLSTPLSYLTFLRDPAERTASHYQHMMRDLDKGRRQTVPELREWLQESVRNFQIRQISGGEDLDEALRIIERRFLFVGLTEQFTESVRIFSALSPWPVITSHEKRNVAPKTDVKQQLLDDPEFRGFIDEATEADRKLYERVRDELFPSYIESADQILMNEQPAEPDDRYKQSRHFTNLVYRPTVKIYRKFFL